MFIQSQHDAIIISCEARVQMRKNASLHPCIPASLPVLASFARAPIFFVRLAGQHVLETRFFRLTRRSCSVIWQKQTQKIINCGISLDASEQCHCDAIVMPSWCTVMMIAQAKRAKMIIRPSSSTSASAAMTPTLNTSRKFNEWFLEPLGNMQHFLVW